MKVKSLNKAAPLQVLKIMKVFKVVVRLQVQVHQVQIQVLPVRKDLETVHKFFQGIILL